MCDHQFKPMQFHPELKGANGGTAARVVLVCRKCFNHKTVYSKNILEELINQD